MKSVCLIKHKTLLVRKLKSLHGQLVRLNSILKILRWLLCVVLCLTFEWEYWIFSSMTFVSPIPRGTVLYDGRPHGLVHLYHVPFVAGYASFKNSVNFYVRSLIIFNYVHLYHVPFV